MNISNSWHQNIITNPRVLIVEDESEMAELIADMIRKGGVEVRIAGDGSAGLQAVEEFDPDVVIADLKMPLMRGDEMLVDLRARGFRKPVIVLTGFGDEEALVKAFRYDAFDFLDKPIPKEILIAVVHKALRVENERLILEAMVSDLTARLEKGGQKIDPVELVKNAQERVMNRRKA